MPIEAAALTAVLRLSRLPPRRPTLDGVVARVIAAEGADVTPRDVRGAVARLVRGGLLYLDATGAPRLTLVGLAASY